MLPCKSNVQQGQANGTQATFQKLILKPGEVTQQVLLNGTIPVAAVHASQVSHVLLHYINKHIHLQLSHCNQRDNPSRHRY
jgi:hypothetical protein